MLNVVLLSAAFFAVMLSFIMLIVDILDVIMLIPVTLNVIMLSATLFFLVLTALH